jgi:hypothetical protein
MKNTIVIMLMLGLIAGTLASCKAGLKGNGNVVTQNRNVTPFTAININGVFPVEIQQDGGPEWVKVVTDENLQKLIKVENSGSTVEINMDDEANFKKSTKMKVVINVKDLRELSYESVGNLTTTMLKLDSLEVNSEAVGKLKLNIESNYLRANLNSVGSTTLTGQVKEVRINNKSVGALNAFNLKANTLMIHNTAVGSAEIYADSAFYIRNESIGTLEYKGPGDVKELSSTGVGKVKKAN